MRPVSEDIKDLLVEAGEGAFAAQHGWGIFIGTEPDTPSTSITIYDTPSGADKVMDTVSKDFMRSAFQIRVRNSEYLRGHEKIIACRDALDRYTSRSGIKRLLVFDGVRYDNIIMERDPFPLLKDSKSRQIWTINGIAFRQEV